MTELNIPDNCGNSPKTRTLLELVTAIALADPELLSGILAEDVRWCPVGGKSVAGASSVCAALVRHGAASSLTINHIVVHGRSGSADGVSEYRRKRRAFYIVVDFTNAKGDQVRAITSFSTDISRLGLPRR
jgi:hypothetical protein